MTESGRQNTTDRLIDFGNDVLNFVLVFLLVVAIRTYVVAPFQVNGASMDNTLHDQEYIIVNKAVYGNFFGYQIGEPKRGDIVVLEPPLERKIYYIKRIIGLPGETVKFEGNQVIIINKEHPKGFVLEEDYPRCVEQEGTTKVNTCSYANVAQREFTVPENSYFVMGDNRMNSTDSRFCFSSCSAQNATPFLDKSHIIGKTYAVIWPFSDAKRVQKVTYDQ